MLLHALHCFAAQLRYLKCMAKSAKHEKGKDVKGTDSLQLCVSICPLQQTWACGYAKHEMAFTLKSKLDLVGHSALFDTFADMTLASGCPIYLKQKQ